MKERILIELTIGEPDIPTPPHLIDVAEKAMRDGRTRYTSGRGELQLLEALVKNIQIDQAAP